MPENRYEYSEHLWITTGIPGNVQEYSFTNATLQGGAENDMPLEFSVACHVGIAAGVETEEQLRDYLRDVLTRAVEATNGDLNFEVQLGPYGDGDGEEA